MNLQEFLHYKTECPLCQNSLTTRFHSEKQQKIRYEENRIIFQVNMDGLNPKQKDYKIGFSFGLKDHSVYIEFYEKNGVDRIELIYKSILDRFKKLNDNLSLIKVQTDSIDDAVYKIYRTCRGCRRYEYSSGGFSIYLREQKHEDLVIACEYFGLTQKIDSGYKVYKLFNYYPANMSKLMFGRFDHEWIVDLDAGSPPERLDTIQTPIIKFISPEETTSRLNTLIIFS